MVAQEAFYIPEHVAEGILRGDYQRIGGVVRWAVGPNKGRIVKLLNPMKLEEGNALKEILTKGMGTIKANPKEAIVVGVGAAVAGSVIIYYKVKNREPMALKNFRKKLRQYVEAIRKGNMNLEVIDNMEAALQKLKQQKNYKEYRVTLSAGDIETLINMIQEYTSRLANNNNLEIKDIERKQSGDTILDLEKCLSIQRKVFEEAV